MTRLSAALAILILALVGSATATAQETAHGLLAPDLTPRYGAVGFQTLYARDPARVFPRGDGETTEWRAREVQVSLWYPAAQTSTDHTPLAYRQLYALEAGGTGQAADTGAAREAIVTAYRDHVVGRGGEADRFEQFLNSPSQSLRDAIPAPGRFPVVFYLTSVSSHPFENAVLFETLAQQGYVVVAVPSVGMHQTRQDRGTRGIHNQLEDVLTSWRTAAALDFVDPDRIGVIGYSRGGQVGSLLMMTRPDIAAFISFDGAEGREMLLPALQASPYYDPARYNRPSLHFFSEVADGFPETRDLVDLAPDADTHVVRLPQLGHGEFGSSFIMQGSYARGPAANRPLERVAPSYQAAVALTVDMLDAYVRNDAQALTRLRMHAPRTVIAPEDLLWE